MGRGSLSKPCFYKLSRWHRSTFRMWILYHKQHQHPKGSRGRYSRWHRFQVTGMIKWGQKSKPRNSCIKKKSLDQKLTPKKSHAEFPGLKNFQKVLNDTCTLYNMTGSTLFGCTLFAELCGQDMRVNYHESSDCFEYPQKSLLKSSHPKKLLAKFSHPKKSWNW